MEKIFLDHPWIIILILLWTLPWKGAALWRAARRGHIGWFLTLLILNTLGILDILYIFVVSNWGAGKRKAQEEQKTVEGPKVRQSQFSSGSKGRMTIV